MLFLRIILLKGVSCFNGGGVFFRWGTSFLRGGGLGALTLVREGGWKKSWDAGHLPPTMGNPASDDQKRLLTSFDRFMWQPMPWHIQLHRLIYKIRAGSNTDQKGHFSQTQPTAQPNLENLSSIQHWSKRALFLNKGHQKFHNPLFNSFSKCLASK